MKYKLLNDGRQKTFAIVLDSGDDVIACLTEFATNERVHAAQFTAIGAFSKATTGFFDFAIKDYRKNEIGQQTEVLVLTGDIGLYNNKSLLHAHVVLGKADGTAHGGHLLQAIVHPTLEVILTESPVYLVRKMDESIGIPLISMDF